MEQPKSGADSGSSNVYALATPASRVPMLTQDEIKRLRKLLADAEQVFVACPVAARALSKR